jgi:ATP-dependent helicase/nuclease subunit A
LIDSLTAVYPHAAAARQEAARSVTDWTKVGKQLIADPELGTRNLELTTTLATPRCLLEKNQLPATEVGAATHIVLQHLDFSRSCTDLDLAEQINSLITRRLLTTAQAKHVDLEAIEWFIGTDLGRRLRANIDHLRREIDFYLAVPPAEFSPDNRSTDPADQVMLRGRIDALLAAPDGLSIVDYKTDRLTEAAIPARTEVYGPQVRLYRRAIQQITGKPVADVYLVFLNPRRIVRAPDV